jgi:hypothetical protein
VCTTRQEVTSSDSVASLEGATCHGPSVSAGGAAPLSGEQATPSIPSEQCCQPCNSPPPRSHCPHDPLDGGGPQPRFCLGPRRLDWIGPEPRSAPGSVSAVLVDPFSLRSLYTYLVYPPSSFLPSLPSLPTPLARELGMLQ